MHIKPWAVGEDSDGCAQLVGPGRVEEVQRQPAALLQGHACPGETLDACTLFLFCAQECSLFSLNCQVLKHPSAGCIRVSARMNLINVTGSDKMITREYSL